jgi:hypothetical protein
MNVSLSNHPRRVIRRAALVIGFSASLVTAFELGLQAHDDRLDEADAALQQAEILLDASVSLSTPKVDREFDRYVSKAINAIEDARDAIQHAEATVDNP